MSYFLVILLEILSKTWTVSPSGYEVTTENSTIKIDHCDEHTVTIFSHICSFVMIYPVLHFMFWTDVDWTWNSNTLATWCEELSHLKRPWCWDWRQEEEETTEDEMVGWHHWLDGHELGEILRDGEGQGGQACCIPRGYKGSDMTEWIELKWWCLLLLLLLLSHFSSVRLCATP